MKEINRLAMTRKELLDLKTKCLKKLQDEKLTKKQEENIVTGKQIGRAHV